MFSSYYDSIIQEYAYIIMIRYFDFVNFVNFVNFGTFEYGRIHTLSYYLHHIVY